MHKTNFCHRCENGEAPFRCTHEVANDFDKGTWKAVAFTGHRPQGLPGKWNENHPENKRVKDWLATQIVLSHDEGYRFFIAGGALGVDMWAAEAVLLARDNGLPETRLVLAVPHLRQTGIWKNEKLLQRYWRIRELADVVTVVTREEYSPRAMFARNVYMVEKADRLLAVWNGSPKGGTFHCLKTGKKAGIEVRVLDVSKSIAS